MNMLLLPRLEKIQLVKLDMHSMHNEILSYLFNASKDGKNLYPEQIHGPFANYQGAYLFRLVKELTHIGAINVPI